MSAIKKIEIVLKSVHLIEQKKLKATKKKNLLASLDRLFNMVTCQCEILDCRKKASTKDEKERKLPPKIIKTERQRK